jgi:hypothetical protein
MAQKNRKNIILEWLNWHFVEAPAFLLYVWRNYILFALNYFSLPVLLKSFLAPWRKYRWNYPKFFDVGEFFTTLISNTFSRFIGAIMRTVLIVLGILFQVFVVLAGAIILVFWFLLPLIIIAGLLFVFIY